MDAKEVLLKTYEDGYTDGVKETVAQILGESRIVNGYRGPVPEELRLFLTDVQQKISMSGRGT
jgi:hypothetical protein